MSTTARGASVLAKLLNLQEPPERAHQVLLTRFGQERFLYRLSTGVHRDRFVLKGGLLLTAMTNQFYRATRDIDMRAFAENNADAIKRMIAEAISHEVPDDGVFYDTEAIRVEEIRAQGEERGLRVLLHGRVGASARINIQLDLAFADDIVLPAETFEYPTLLDEYPPPVLRAYSVESVIAEKLEAIASLDERTTRMKDFDDIILLASHRDFDVATLWLAVDLTFKRRDTDLGRLLPALGPARASSERETMYARYRTTAMVQGNPTTFAKLLQQLREFAEGVVQYARDGRPRKWRDGTWIAT